MHRFIHSRDEIEDRDDPSRSVHARLDSLNAVDLFEYQARDLFAAHGVPVLRGEVATTPARAQEIAKSLGGKVVVKAQVKVGGRGKAGGVKLADGPDDAYAKADAILGMDIKGHVVHRVLVAEASDIAEEYYFSFLLDRSNRTFLAMASREGGVEIEQIAVETPDALAKVPIDAMVGVDVALAREIAVAAGYPTEILDQAADVIVALWDVFTKEDATLVEVNPLVKTPDGVVLALDGKVTLDENAAFRQPGHARACRRRGHRPARSARQRGASELREARRPSRRHRQRGWTRDEHARRRVVCGRSVSECDQPTSSTSVAVLRPTSWPPA